MRNLSFKRVNMMKEKPVGKTRGSRGRKTSLEGLVGSEVMRY